MDKSIFNIKKLLMLCASCVLIVCLAILACFDFIDFSLIIKKVFAASAGPQSPTIASNNSGAGTVAWSNVDNVMISDNYRAEAVLNKNVASNYLVAAGFDFSVIPDGAVILGITAEAERSEAGNTTKSGIVDSEVRIVQDGIINTAQNKADTATLWPGAGSESHALYGGASDLWGISWTAGQIKSANFGVAISAKNFKISGGGGAETARIDHIRVTVAYREGYATSGTYISNDFNAGSPSVFNAIEWSENKTNPLCASCDIKLQIKTAPDSGGSPGAWSASWCGPEGEDGDETDYFTVSAGQLIHTDHNGDQWIKYKATLEGDGVDAPILEEIRINYK